MGFFSGLLGNAGVVDPQKLAKDYGRLLADGESIDVGFALLRDTFVFTNKRLILIDISGITGSKIEYLSVPYSKITKYSIQTAGTFDLDAELKIWVGSDPDPIAKTFTRNANIYDLQQVLAKYTL